ncbi:phospholipid-translocating P-type ATPase [Schizopora paradoxa]|uniref:Phospholipid-transporting ATPase n=1 Tax=Schizopora paradoxa TaxID=27342 RepID=A0A0H2RJY5_9AGAM|nr:phospholipid-translocating P-type ATPase [Schizopora paradoxa]
MSSQLRPHPDNPDDTDDERDNVIDPELRLRTVRTAASTIAESYRNEERVHRKRSRLKRLFSSSRSKEKRKEKSDDEVSSQGDLQTQPAPVIKGQRRNVYVNVPLPPPERDAHGEPIARYVRNKVRTSKYTIITFIPRNLYEQFRRVANLFFLALVVIQSFPIFGAAGSQISFLPLAFIITVTAIKDGIEDYRRALLDDEVNNSAATKLGDWRNVNQPKDPRSWIERALGLNAPGKVTKGVKKLRAKEAEKGGWSNGRIVLERTGEMSDVMSDSERTAAEHGADDSSVTLGGSSILPKLMDADRSEQSISYNTYPPPPMSINSTATRVDEFAPMSRYRSDSIASRAAMSTKSRKSFGVVNWNRRATGTAKWERTLWKKLEVGDIVLLREDDQVPADIIVLSTSDPEGLCYLETKNLDGETNLKPRKSLKATSSLQSEEDIEHASFVLDSEPPHANLYIYNGVLKYRSGESQEEKIEPVTINEFLLRGCSVRNTSWIIGLVAFTGADTKIMLNSGSTPSKRSKIEKETNFNVVMNFVILFVMCLAAAIVSGLLDGQVHASSHFFEEGSDPSSSHLVNAIITFGSCLVAFQNIVPISLYISIEIVKTIQAYFISQDIEMFYAPYDTAVVPKSWNISDDLGQIEYIFSDKTGTLTQNVMEFQKCSVHGVKYGEGITEAMRGAALRAGVKDALDPEEQADQLRVLKQDMLQTMTHSWTNNWLQTDKLTLISPQIVQDLSNRQSEQRKHLIAFFRALAVCHSVLANKPEPQMEPYRLEYKAESPDEAALVAAARDIGFPFVGKRSGILEIEVMGKPERYVLMKMLEFNSTRKRMSVVVRNPEGKLVLYTKGADSVIYARLADDQDPAIKEKTSKDMEDFANGGLRTLCIAYRYISEEEYADWSKAYDAAAASVKDRDDNIEEANQRIEHSLHILGATALEDKLQEGVPESIEMLHKAGIKLWILTGDKVQTAIEIGYSCNLLKQDMDVMIISATSAEETRSKIEAGLNKLTSVLGPVSTDPKKRGFIPGARASFAVVIDGDTLRHALDPHLRTLFLNLATQCETVVCCRVSPAQKALTVKMVKEGKKAMTLSIGDGANDVAMIQEANIGCGLLGLEGSQAAMSADYAFGQFRFLTRLLIVHGRWSYMRVADMHANFFYKNVIWTLAMFWFLFFNSFDATYLYEYTFILLCNLVFTSLPVIAMGAFDQDLNARASLAFPQLYLRGIRGLDYTRTKFWLYMFDGLYQSVIVFFIPYLVWTLGPAVSWDGKAMDSLADFGTTASVAAILCANLYVGLNTHYWTIITWIVVVGSCLVSLIWIGIYSLFNTPDFNDELVVLYGSVIFWATVTLAIVAAIGPRYVVKFISTSFMPLDRDIVREMWVLGDLKKQLGIKSRKEQKRAKKSSRDLESSPMYPNHDRSFSSTSSAQLPGYEAALTNSPGNMSMVPTPPQTLGVGFHSKGESKAEQAGYRDDASSIAYEGVSYIVEGDPDEVVAGASPAYNRVSLPPSVSPNPSYYSASDIPIPSPIPSPEYYTYDQGLSPNSVNRLSTPRRSTLAPPAPIIPRTRTPDRSPDSYEMQVRPTPSQTPALQPPPSSFPSYMSPEGRPISPYQRAESQASGMSYYATASEHWTDDEDDDQTINEHNHNRTQRESSYSTSPHAI